jgi:hypothetical protein
MTPEWTVEVAKPKRAYSTHLRTDKAAQAISAYHAYRLAPCRVRIMLNGKVRGRKKV